MADAPEILAGKCHVPRGALRIVLRFSHIASAFATYLPWGEFVGAAGPRQLGDGLATITLTASGGDGAWYGGAAGAWSLTALQGH